MKTKLLPSHFRISMLKSTLIKRMTFCLFLCAGTSFNSAAADYYWVGGSGDWSDIGHWATASGGNIHHLQVPTAFDDVYFDNNSFYDTGQSVNVNAGNYICHNIDWTGVQHIPEFKTDGAHALKICGSITLVPDMEFNYSGQIFFEATDAGHTIKTAGHHFINNIVFCGLNGGWSLAEDMVVNQTIYLVYGSFNTNGYQVECRNFYSRYQSPRSLILNSSTIKVAIDWGVNSTNMVLIAGTSTIKLASPNSAFSTEGGSLSYNNVVFTDTAGFVVLNTLPASFAAFHRLTFICDAKIMGTNKFDNLYLMNGFYEFPCLQQQTISDSLVTTGSCRAWTVIRSATDSIQAIIYKPSGMINLEYIILKDISATGGAIFNAVNSIDLSNNTGWLITNPLPKNLYWVGGSGNWDDYNHWSLSSGGPGGACVPSPFDNVYFDNLSFNGPGQIVNINTIHVFCHNMRWTGAQFQPGLSGVFSKNLNIFGSLTFIPAMNMDFEGKTHFCSNDSTETITSAGHSFNNCIFFNGPHGGWTLMDALDTGPNIIYLIYGTLNTNNQKVTCLKFNSSLPNQRGLHLGTSLITVTGPGSQAWILQGLHLDFDAGHSLIQFTNNNSGMTTNCSDTLRYYDVIFTAQCGLSSIFSSGSMVSYHDARINNDGTLNGNNMYYSLFLDGIYYVLESQKNQIIVDTLIINSACFKLVFLCSSQEFTTARLMKNSGILNLSYLILQDVEACGGAVFNAYYSAEIFNNIGWNVFSPAAQDLYWVGGDGSWDDISHWSQTSGGAGGVCIPSPSDNIIFDINSFDTSAQVVLITSSNVYCHNMTWNQAAFHPELKGSLSTKIRVFGSLTLQDSMEFNYSGYIYFESHHLGHTITTCGNIFPQSVYFTGNYGSWDLLDDFTTLKNFHPFVGTINTNDHTLTCYTFSSYMQGSRCFNFGQSEIILTGGCGTEWYINRIGLTLNAGTSTISCISPNAGFLNVGSDSLTFHNVLFTSSSGLARLNSTYGSCYFNKVIMRSNGNISGKNTFDTLTFYPAMTYILEANKYQTINKRLDMCGNGCFPITLKSSIPGYQSAFYKASGNVNAAYVEMHDQNATGGAVFSAGIHSTDVSNNTGWYFNFVPGYFFGIPDSAMVCPGDTLLLDTYNFIGGVSFLWQDGSTGSNYNVTQPGMYWVSVTYADECQLIDTSMVSGGISPEVAITADTSICPGIQLLLEVQNPGNGQYLWSTGASGSVISVIPSQTTSYFVTYTNACGNATDMVNVVTFPLPDLIMPADTSMCPGTNLTLSATGTTGNHYIWNTGDTSSSITVNPTQATTYYVTATDQNNCAVEYGDVTVSTFPRPIAIAGTDFTICPGSSAALNIIGLPGSTYNWSNGMSGSTIIVSPLVTTTYIVSVTDINSCGTATDDITITISDMPAISVSNDTIICPGSQITLTALAYNYTAIVWNTGDTGSSIVVYPQIPTIYTAIAMNSCGFVIDSVEVNMLAVPLPQFIVTDESCNRGDGSIIVTGGNSYLWSDGNTVPYITGLSAGIYLLTVSGDFCDVEASVAVGNIPGPDAGFTVNHDMVYVGGGSFIFSDTSVGAVSWNWNFGDNIGTSAEQNPQYLYNNIGTYTVTQFVTDIEGCSDTAQKEVTLEYPEWFYIANAFTPNGDINNEEFGPVIRLPEEITAFEMAIYNRWGEMVFFSDDPAKWWNGRYGKDGDKVPDGVYTWIIKMTHKPALENQYLGSVTVIR